MPPDVKVYNLGIHAANFVLESSVSKEKNAKTSSSLEIPVGFLFLFSRRFYELIGSKTKPRLDCISGRECPTD